MNDYRPEPPYRPKKIGCFFLFCFSALPGANYMHMGFMKKGIFAMSSFFLTIYLLSAFRFYLLAFLIPIIWFTSFFDGFRIRRCLNDGIYVADDIDPILNFAKKYTFHILVLVSLLFGASLISNSFNYFFGDFENARNTKRILDLLPSFIVILAGYFLIKVSSKKKNDIVDKRNNDNM